MLAMNLESVSFKKLSNGSMIVVLMLAWKTPAEGG